MTNLTNATRRGEIMDRLDLPAADAERALRDLRRVNRMTLGAGSLVRSLLPRLAEADERGEAGEPQSVADLGTGSGDAAEALSRAALETGRPLRVVGVDRKLSHLLVGRDQGTEQLRVVADVAALPFRDGALDWTVSTLLLHHFDGDESRAVLAESVRVSRRGSLTVDLRRSRLAPALIRLVLPLLRVGPVAYYDGKVSIDQAWSLDEAADLAAGFEALELRRRFPFRFSLLLAGRQPDDNIPSR